MTRLAAGLLFVMGMLLSGCAELGPNPNMNVQAIAVTAPIEPPVPARTVATRSPVPTLQCKEAIQMARSAYTDFISSSQSPDVSSKASQHLRDAFRICGARREAVEAAFLLAQRHIILAQPAFALAWLEKLLAVSVASPYRELAEEMAAVLRSCWSRPTSGSDRFPDSSKYLSQLMLAQEKRSYDEARAAADELRRSSCRPLAHFADRFLRGLR